MNVRSIAVTVAVAALLILIRPADAQKKEFRWKLNKGQQLRLVVEQTAASETTIRQSTIKMTVRMGFEMDWNVKEVDKGVARIEQTFSRVHMRMESPKIPAIAFDSASKAELSEPAQKMARSLAPLLNLTFHVAMNDRGAIQDVQLPSESKDSLANLPPQLKDIFSKEGLQRTLQQCASELPEKAIGEGEKWSSETKGPTRLGTMTTKSEFTYTADVSRDGKQTSQIDVTAKFSLQPKSTTDPAGKSKPNSGNKINIKRQELKGTMFFDNTRGLLTESQTDQTLITQIRKKDLVLETKSQTTMRMKLRILK